MRIKLFYKSLSGGREEDKNIFLKNFIEEVAFRDIYIELVEFSSKKSRKRSISLFRSGNRLSTGDVKTNSSADISIVDFDLNKELIREIISWDNDKSSIFVLHDHYGKAISKGEKLKYIGTENFAGVIVGSQLLIDYYTAYYSEAQICDITPGINPRQFFERKKEKKWDVVFVGNGDKGRIAELEQMFLLPVKELGLKAAFSGSGFSQEFIRKAKGAGIEYKEVIPNEEMPEFLSEAECCLVLKSRRKKRSEKVIPLVMLECFAVGVPVISNFVGNPHLVSNNNYLFSDEKETTIEVIRSVKTDKPRVHFIKNNGLRTANKYFTCWHRASKFLDFTGSIRLSRENTDHKSFANVS